MILRINGTIAVNTDNLFAIVTDEGATHVITNDKARFVPNANLHDTYSDNFEDLISNGFILDPKFETLINLNECVEMELVVNKWRKVIVCTLSQGTVVEVELTQFGDRSPETVFEIFLATWEASKKVKRNTDAGLYDEEDDFEELDLSESKVVVPEKFEDAMEEFADGLQDVYDEITAKYGIELGRIEINLTQEDLEVESPQPLGGNPITVSRNYLDL